MSRRDVLGAAAVALLARPERAAAAPPPCLDRLLQQRRMIRRFTKAPVSDATVRRLIGAARRAPSAGHTEPWAFIVVREARMLRALAHAALDQSFIAEAPVAIVACADRGRVRPRYGARGDQYALIDASFASMLLLLAVTEAGLGATFVGAFRDEEVIRLLGLPEPVLPIAIIPIGVPAESPRPLRLRTTDDVIRHERW